MLPTSYELVRGPRGDEPEIDMMARTVGDRDSMRGPVAENFKKRFGTNPSLFRAPGRVNLIGEHTDYNQGFVMPAAIDFYTWVAAAPQPGSSLTVYTEQYDETVELPLSDLSGTSGKHWSDYVRGVAAVLSELDKPTCGVALTISGDVPLGAGLSSSASLEVALALALSAIWNIEIPPLQQVKACQRAEHEYAGIRCGIMDQFIVTFGSLGHALLLDCRSLDYQLLLLPADVRIIICNSMVKHELASSEYNRRRAECEVAVEILRRHLPQVRSLRDASMSDLERCHGEMSDVIFRRCRHVVSENQRVLAAGEALRKRELGRFGELMRESHASLREDYEVSCGELDVLTDLASECEGVYGARMTGGGFGGCTVNLANAEAVEGLRAHLIEGYQRKTGITPKVYVCTPADGARAL